VQQGIVVRPAPLHNQLPQRRLSSERSGMHAALHYSEEGLPASVQRALPRRKVSGNALQGNGSCDLRVRPPLSDARVCGQHARVPEDRGFPAGVQDGRHATGTQRRSGRYHGEPYDAETLPQTVRHLPGVLNQSENSLTTVCCFRLECNDECKLIQRNQMVAISLQIRNPDLSAKLTPRYSDSMREWAKKDPAFCQMVHDRLTELVKLAKEVRL